MGNSLISLAPAKGSLGSRGGGAGCSRLHGSVGQDSAGELLLGLGEAGTCPSVLRVDHFQEDDSQDGVHSEKTSHHHHDHSHSQV